MAAAALQLHYGGENQGLEEIQSPAYSPRPSGGYRKISINIGRDKRIAPNHIVAAIAGKTGMNGREIGKIEIFDNETVVAIPESRFDETLEAMADCQIGGNPTVAKAYKGVGYGQAPRSFPRDHRPDNRPDYRRLPKKRELEGRGRKKY